ncbi:hypothetical protein [Rhodococcus sp. X156]|uniref:hypothetical protein n=1 Tax=Rhodococcus sp. X156 TaxID=2499145 RepID=UPI000FD8921B|nr:hypothetical protein [Rhodococcus sp. X156]
MTHISAVAPRRRRPRQDPDSVRATMMDTARRMVAEDQLLAAGLEGLGMEEVIVRADVPRGSVYRIWPYRKDFVHDLLIHLATPDWFRSGSLDRQTLRATGQVLLENYDLISANRSAAERLSVAHEALRVGTETNFEFMRTDESWRMYTVLTATVRSIPDPHTRHSVSAALEQAEWTLTSTLAHFYAQLAEVAGLRLTDPARGYSGLATAGAAVLEGLSLRYQFAVRAADPARVPARERPWEGAGAAELEARTPGPPFRGQPRAWSLAAWSFRAVFDSYLECVPVPDFHPKPIATLVNLLDTLAPPHFE